MQLLRIFEEDHDAGQFLRHLEATDADLKALFNALEVDLVSEADALYQFTPGMEGDALARLQARLQAYAHKVKLQARIAEELEESHLLHAIAERQEIAEAALAEVTGK